MSEFITNNAVWIAPVLSGLILVLQIAQAKVAALSGTAAPNVKNQQPEV